MWLIAGLGNPGPKYAQNRHNIGFTVVDELARRAKAEGFRTKFGGELTTCTVAGARAALLKPMEYMNLSGRAVQRSAAFYQVAPAEIVVVHDEIDLELGRLQVKVGGGTAGHNGIKSIAEHMGTPDFVRVRCGVGRPAGSRAAAGHVLADFGKSELTEVQILVQEAADAIEAVVAKGPLLAMNAFNKRPSPA